MALIIEIATGRGSDVRARVRVDALPFTMGRAYDNDLILDDAYVDARHARIVCAANGLVVLEDLGSINGIVAPDSSERPLAVEVRSGTAVRIGRTTLRFRDTLDAVTPALRDGTANGRPARALPGGSWGQAAFSVIALTLVAAFMWFGSYDASGIANTLATFLGLGMLAAAWAGVWSIAGRVAVQRFDFLSHLAVFCAVMIVGLGLGAVTSWVSFVLPSLALATTLGALTGGALLTLLIAGHLQLSSQLAKRRRWWTAFGISVALLAIGAGMTLTSASEFSDVPRFTSVLKPLNARLIPATTVVDFSRGFAALKAEVDASQEQ